MVPVYFRDNSSPLRVYLVFTAYICSAYYLRVCSDLIVKMIKSKERASWWDDNQPNRESHGVFSSN